VAFLTCPFDVTIFINFNCTHDLGTNKKIIAITCHLCGQKLWHLGLRITAVQC